MYHPIIFFIGLRYARGCTADRFNFFFSWLSTIGIMIGVMSMVTIFSVMNAFESNLKENILGLIPQAILSSSEGSINPDVFPKTMIKLKEVLDITPLTIGDVILYSAHNVATGVMLGIDPEQRDTSMLNFIDVNSTELIPGKYNVILGYKLARQLSIGHNDQLRVMIPSVGQFTPMGYLPSQKIFNVIGMFSTNSEVDNYQILINIQDASRLMRYPIGNITGWRLWLNEPMEVNILSQKTLLKDIKWRDWRESKGEFFQAIRMERNMIGLLLSLIITVSSFNIITSLSLMIIEKRREVAILKTYGLKPYQIMMIFIIYGAISSIIGSLFGVALGVIFAYQINNLISFFGLSVDLILPVKIDSLQIINILLSTIIITLFSTFYPAWRAAVAQPVRILNYE